MIPWRQQYADPARDASLGFATAIECDPAQDKTLQQYKEEADINTMIRRFGVMGTVERSRGNPVYGDFTIARDFQSSLEAVRAAQRDFDALPAEIRERFANDPGRLLRFVENDANREEAQRLGLLRSKPAEEPVSAPAEEPAA